ncbi:MAG: hypothetical protein ABJL44_07430, partial [Algibacter sp.]
MLKLKIIFLILPLFLFVNKIQAQYLWYENETETENILFSESDSGTFTTNETNPDQTGINTNTTSTKFIRDSNVTRGFSYFKLYEPIETATNMTITLKAYIDIATVNLAANNRLRLYFKNTTTGELFYKQLTFSAGQEWQNFSFSIASTDFTSTSLVNGGYDEVYIGYGNGQSSTTAITYYVDQIYGSIEQEVQYTWYENETDINDIILSTSDYGTFSTNEVNPDQTGNNNNLVASKFVRQAATNKGFTYFDLYQPIETAEEHKINLKGYIDISTANLLSSGDRLRVYLKNTTTGDIIYKQIIFTVGQEWENFSFVFNTSDFTSTGLGSGGYNQMYIGYGNGKYTSTAITYYVDSIHATVEQFTYNTNVDWLEGSWGITFPVFGGERLDTEVAGGYDLVSGAQEVVDSLPAVGHVITNLSYFAHSHYFTLRTNPNVDIVNEIHESLVPSLANEAIILDVLQKFKDSGKKVILYISTNYMDRASDEVKAAWLTYYTNEFAGSEYLAYEDLIQGFVERMKDYADGYWLDTTTNLGADSRIEDFISMIKATDPGAVVTANYQKNYFSEDGTEILVDTDGVEDDDETDYKIVLHETLNTYQDFTNGHVTPLGNGAPPNSWGYDEYTLPNMVQSPWTNYNGTTTLKHAWFPIRKQWHSPRTDLVFEIEQAYRYIKSVTDAGAAITFANTIDYGLSDPGYMMADEMAIMKEINDRLLMTIVPNYIPYSRPVGAFLVGEDQIYPWYENEEDTTTDYIPLNSTTQGSLTEDFTNPFQTGNNTSSTVAKFIRSGGNPARTYFDLPNPITDLSSLKISLDAFIDLASPSTIDYRIRVYLLNSTLNTIIYKQ